MTRLGTGGEQGFALVLTLVVTALMVAVAAEMIHQVHVDTSLSRGFRDGQQASLLAESGITGGTKLLQTALSGQSYSSLSDRWAAPLKLDDEIGTIEISAVEESGKINLNGLVLPQSDGVVDNITEKVLKRLGRRLEIPEDVWGALADWLDSNDLPGSGGAEASYYKTLKPPYTQRNGNLKTLAELSLVKGFTPEIVAKLRPFVTVYYELDRDPAPKININTAPREVLAALVEDDDRTVERIMEHRRLQPFKAPGELSQFGIKIGDPIMERGGVKGGVYRITAVARVKETARTVEAVVRPNNTPAVVLSWQEY